MGYRSLQDILDDQELDLGEVDSTVDALRHAIDHSLQLMQAATLTQTSDVYRRLIEARAALEQIGGTTRRPRGTDLIPMPVAILEQLLEAVQRAHQTSPGGGSSATERMQTQRSMAITKEGYSQ